MTALRRSKTTKARKTLKAGTSSARKTLTARKANGARTTLKAKSISRTRAHFEGDIRTEWIKETSKNGKGIKMKLIDDFIFVDQGGTKWPH